MKNFKFALGTAAATLAVAFLCGGAVLSGRNAETSGAVGSHAENLAWLTDFAAAQQKAKAENKPLLLDFTGSDWCGWCMKLDHEVFSTDAFRDYANKHLVLVKVDFPIHKEQTAAERAQNEQLQSRFQVEGYPTVVVLDAAGKQIGTLGYMSGGPQPFIGKLGSIVGS